MYQYQKIIESLYVMLFRVEICFGLLAACFLPITVWAEMQPFYNFSVTIDRAEDEQFNEKIEVYIEKDGQFYADYDLSRINQYLYSTELGTGSYRLYARVRYDSTETYRVEPEYQDLEITNQGYKDMHMVMFKITGGTVLDEAEHMHEHGLEEAESLNEEEVYTIDRIDELKKIQDDARIEASKAFQENEDWEKKHNFLARNGIEDPAISLEQKKGAILPDHSYPEDETDETEIIIENVPQTSMEVKVNVESEPNPNPKQNAAEVPEWIIHIGNIFAVISFLLIFIVVIIIYRKYNKQKE